MKLSKFIIPLIAVLLTLTMPVHFVTWQTILTVAVLVVLAMTLPVKVRPGVYTNGAGQVSQYGLAQSFARAKASLIAAYTSGPNAMTYDQAKQEAENAVLSQSYLRLEQPLVNTTTLFKFPILNNQTSTQPIRPTEVRLNQQDAFMCNNIQIYIALASSAAAVNFVPKTYPNPVTFAAAAQLYTFYNGFLKITINKSVIVPNYPMTNFLQIPQTQETAATNSPGSQFDPTISSLWEPTINFIGTKQSDISVEVPALFAPDANTYGIIILQGVLAQNVTNMS